MRMDRSRSELGSLSTVMSLLLSCGVIAQARAEVAAAPEAREKTAAEFAVRGQRDARAIKYDQWNKICFKTPGSPRVCRTSISGQWETGQSAVRIDLTERDGEGTARLQLFLPVGVYLQAGAKLSVDQGVPVQIPYTWCLTNTCIAGDRADPALLRQMETGQQLKLEIADTNLLSVSTTIPLGQFAAVHASAPIRTYEQNVDE